jgi:hypothetical protein
MGFRGSEVQIPSPRPKRTEEGIWIGVPDAFLLVRRASEKFPFTPCLPERPLCFPQIPTCDVLLNLAKRAKSDPTLSGAIFPRVHVLFQVADKKCKRSE